MIHLKDNTCPICYDEELCWHLKYNKTDIEMFKCGHGACKKCFQKLNQYNLANQNEFSCPICKTEGQLHTTNIKCYPSKWITFAEWYNEFDIYITSGCADNVIRNTIFGKQLLRLMDEAKKEKKDKLEKREIERKQLIKELKAKERKERKERSILYEKNKNNSKNK
jgi:hypothetical protein